MYESMFLIISDIDLIYKTNCIKLLKGEISYSAFKRISSWIVREVDAFVCIFLFGQISKTTAMISAEKRNENS